MNALTADPNLWNDAVQAQKLTTEKNLLEEKLNTYKSQENSLTDLLELCEMAEADND